MTAQIAELVRRRPWWLAPLLLIPILLLTVQGMTFRADAAGLDWIDGGDDQLCLQDDNGAALSHPEIVVCSPIIGCETGETNGKAWIRFPNKNGIWQPKDEYKDYIVYYGSEPTTSPSPSSGPTTKPTTKPSASPTKKPTKGSTTKPSASPTKPASGATATPTAGATTPSTTDDLGIDENEEVAAGAPTAPAAPTVAVDGDSVTVTWTASADAELEGVTGYSLRFSNVAEPVVTDAATTSHTFTGLADGNYRAAVRAVNTAGESPSSPPSDIATVGAPIDQVKGEVTVDGELQPGAEVTVTGTGYAASVPELVLELHSTPVQLATVATDADGGFSTTVTVPVDIEPGEHHLVVLYDGAEVTSTPVQLVAATTEADTDAETEAAEDVATVPAASVPPNTGVAILGALAALGVLALAWHPLRARRRRRSQHARGAQLAPTVPAVAGRSAEVV